MALEYWNYNYAKRCYTYLKTLLNGNGRGAAGILGNIYAESNICPFRQQGQDYTTSQLLTDTVFKTGDKDNFVYYDGNTGYSLAQWTTYDRRSNYWDFVGGPQYIGDATKSLHFLAHELQTGYSGVWNTCLNATDIYTASTKVLTDYEAPEDTSMAVRMLRASYAGQIFNDFDDAPYGGGTLPVWLIKKIIDKRYFS